MGRDPLVQLLALITCPFPWLNLILHGSGQPLLWHCRLALNLMSGFCVQALLGREFSWGGRWGRGGNSTASPSGLWWGLWQGTSQSWEALTELRKAEVSSHTFIISPPSNWGLHTSPPGDVQEELCCWSWWERGRLQVRGREWGQMNAELQVNEGVCRSLKVSAGVSGAVDRSRAWQGLLLLPSCSATLMASPAFSIPSSSLNKKCSDFC